MRTAQECYDIVKNRAEQKLNADLEKAINDAVANDQLEVSINTDGIAPSLITPFTEQLKKKGFKVGSLFCRNESSLKISWDLSNTVIN